MKLQGNSQGLELQGLGLKVKGFGAEGEEGLGSGILAV